MKPLSHLRTIALFLSLLVISLPFTLAEEFSRSYDLNGNLISDGRFYREYNGLNQLIKVYNGSSPDANQLLESYRWHPIEERIVTKKIYENGTLKETVYYPTKEYVRIVNSSGTFDEVYVHQENQLVAFIDTDNNKNFVHSDHIGSVSLLTDEQGSIIEETFYSPYGEILEGGTKSRFDYEGKEFDEVTGRLDFGFRQIDPTIPVWDKADTKIRNVYEPQSLNRYMFEEGNPYRYTDPDGHAAVVPVIMKAIELCLTQVCPVVIVLLTIHQENKKKDAQKQQEQLDDVTAEDVIAVSEQARAQFEQQADLSLEEQTEERLTVPDGVSPPKIDGITEEVGDGLTIEDVSLSTKEDESLDSTSNINTITGNTVQSPFSSSLANSGNFGDRFSSAGGKPKVSKDGTVTLGSGGRSGSFRCYARSCSVSKPYKKTTTKYKNSRTSKGKK